MQYVDASALLKTHLDEPDRHEALSILNSDADWASGRHTLVEVRRNLVRSVEPSALGAARDLFRLQWGHMRIAELDEPLCERAAELAESTGVRALDALHLGAADVLGGGEFPFVTFDRRLATAARSLGWTVLGA
ncbi:MAG: type II toxin-antitoxin system VapC family toxin [Actinomycetota bacterium]|nr:type II toxin-antitoxin system VapC family toxin [Actinomycetota bacterium]